MLVLALEFSRGCTAHAGAGPPRRADESIDDTTRHKPPGRGTHGVSGPRRRTQHAHAAKKQAKRPGRRAELDSDPPACPAARAYRTNRAEGTSPGSTRQTGRSLKTK